MHNEDENTPRKVSDEIINFAPAEQKFRSAGVRKITRSLAPGVGYWGGTEFPQYRYHFGTYGLAHSIILIGD